MPSSDPHSDPLTEAACAPLALEVRDLAFSYGGFDVLQGVSFSLEAGELAFLVGGERLRQIDAAALPCRLGGGDGRRRLSRRRSVRYGGPSSAPQGGLGAGGMIPCSMMPF